MNLGTQTGYSIYDIIKTVEKVTGYKVNYEVLVKNLMDILCGSVLMILVLYLVICSMKFQDTMKMTILK